MHIKYVCITSTSPSTICRSAVLASPDVQDLQVSTTPRALMVFKQVKEDLRAVATYSYVSIH